MKSQLSVSDSRFADNSRSLSFSLALGMAILLLVGFAFAQDKAIALKGGKLLTVTHGVIENGVIVMQGGKISAVGAASSVKIPSGAQIIDARGMTIIRTDSIETQLA